MIHILRRPAVQPGSAYYFDVVRPLSPDFHASLNDEAGTNITTQVGPAAGTYNGGVSLKQPTWNSNKGLWAVGLDGVDDYLLWSDHATFDFALGESFTLACLINVASTSGGGDTLYDKKNGTAAGYVIFLSSTGLFAAQIGDSVGNSTNTHAAGGDLRDDTWHHVVARYDNDADTLDLFVDGVKDSLTSVTRLSLENAEDFSFGRAHNAAGFNDFEGSVDELSMWRSALSDANISTLYSGTGL